MKTCILKIFVVIIWVFGSAVLHAQETISTANGEATSFNGKISYTIGQTFYTMHTSDYGHVAEGVQLSYDILTHVGPEITHNLQLMCFPNPTANKLTLKVDNHLTSLSYQLYSMEGKLIMNKQFTKNQTVISLDGYASGIYFMKIVNEQRVIKTLKIVKIDKL